MRIGSTSRREALLPMPKTAVIAFGGNAFTRAGQTGTYEEQAENALSMARCVLAIRTAGWDVVIVHGNGPQVGNLAIQQEEGRRLVPVQPLFSLGAMTQGEMGSLISLALRAIDADVPVAALVTHVIVAAEDPAFGAPAKPIGPFFTPERASELAAERGWVVRDDARPRLPSGGRITAADRGSSRRPRSSRWSASGADSHRRRGRRGARRHARRCGPPRRRGCHRQGLRRGSAGHGIGGTSRGVRDRRSAIDARFRSPGRARPGRDRCRVGRAISAREPVPGREHGPEGPGCDAVPTLRRPPCCHHYAGVGGSHP